MAQDGATAIVSGAEVLAILAVLIMNVLGPSLTRGMCNVEATEQRRVPNVHAINKAFMRHIMAQDGAMVIVSGAMVYAI